MKKSDLTQTKAISYRAKWWAYKRFCKKVGSKPIPESTRRVLEKAYDSLIHEDLLLGKICNIFTGYGSVKIRGRYLKIRDKDGNIKPMVNFLKTQYEPVYDEDGRLVYQWGLGEYWDYRVIWSRPKTSILRKLYFNESPRIRPFINKQVVKEDPVLYKYKENIKQNSYDLQADII